MKILAIETSCDETAAAVIEDGRYIITNVVASSKEIHQKYGGIVPEIAARKQVESLIPVITEAVRPFQRYAGENYRQTVGRSFSALAVSVGPGLIGSLLVGIESAKSLSMVTGLPLIPVNHVIAHMYANFLLPSAKVPSVQDTVSATHNPQLITDNPQPISFPAISLVVSGGHTELYLMLSPKDLTWLGGTLDDAAGEAFDKGARLIGLGGGGGPAVAETAEKFKTDNYGRQPNIRLPRPLNDDSFKFSFSGLKTALSREWQKHSNKSPTGIDNLQIFFAHELQSAITDVLVKKTMAAADKYSAKSILVSGGVAANICLRKKFTAYIHRQPTTDNQQLFIPPVHLCTDNAAYIAAAAYYKFSPVPWNDIQAQPDMDVEIGSPDI